MNNLYLFGNYKYFNENKLIFSEKGINLIFINTYKDNKTFSVKEIIDEFKNNYIEGNSFVLSLGKVSINNNLINISKAIEEIIKLYLIPIKNFIGSNYRNSLVFNNKIPTLGIIGKYGLTPISYKLIDSELDIKYYNNFPTVLKIDGLTGGCGMRYIDNYDELIMSYREFSLNKYNDIFVSEFIEGIEISFSIFRIGDNFIRLPISYREKSNNKLTHPDDKLKITGFLGGFGDFFEKIENLMIGENIYGSFYIEGIYDENEGNIKFLESGTRLSGSTPIRFKSMVDYNIFEQIRNYIIGENVIHPVSYSLSLQYGYSIINLANIDMDFIKKISFSYKIENKGDLQFSNSNSLRLRININSSDLYSLFEIMDNLGSAIGEKGMENRTKNFIKNLILLFGYKDILSPICNVIRGLDSKFYIGNFTGKEENVTAVMGIIIDSNANILLVNNSKRGIGLPGGHIELNETMDMCITREIREEAGINIDNLSYIGFNEIKSQGTNYYNKTYILYYFKILDYEMEYGREYFQLMKIEDFLNLKTNSSKIVDFVSYFLNLFKHAKNSDNIGCG